MWGCKNHPYHFFKNFSVLLSIHISKYSSDFSEQNGIWCDDKTSKLTLILSISNMCWLMRIREVWKIRIILSLILNLYEYKLSSFRYQLIDLSNKYIKELINYFLTSSLVIWLIQSTTCLIKFDLSKSCYYLNLLFIVEKIPSIGLKFGDRTTLNTTWSKLSLK